MTNPKIPPHSTDAEKSVLGALLIDKDAVTEVAEFLRPDMFYSNANGLIFEAMSNLYEDRDPIDVLTVSEKLKASKNLTKVGGRAYLSSLSNEVPVASHILKYAQILKETFIKRQMIGLGARLGEWAFDEGMGLDDVLDKAEQAVFSLSQKNVKKSFIPVKDALAGSVYQAQN